MQNGDGLGAGPTMNPPAVSSSDPRAPILIVDDYSLNLVAFKAILDDPRHDIMLASSGQEALALVEKREFAVILLDFRMPELNGFQTAALIRLRPKSRTTPILFLTAFDAPPQEITEAYSLCTDFIQKPVEDVVLRSKVATFVDLYFRQQGASAGLQSKVAALEQTIRQQRLQLERCTCGCIPVS